MGHGEAWWWLLRVGALLGGVLSGIFLLGLPPWMPGTVGVLVGLWLGFAPAGRDRSV